MQKRLEIGQIVNTFGIKGEVKVVPFTDDIRRFDELEKVYVKIKGESKQYQIENVKYHKNMVLLKFKGIDKIEEAEKLRNAFLEIDREDAIPLEEGTYFIADLIGLKVYTDEGISGLNTNLKCNFDFNIFDKILTIICLLIYFINQYTF